VTGGARRIGKAIVEDLAAGGFGVAIHCNRSRQDADMLAESIAERGGHAVVVQADLADRGAMQGLIDEAKATLGSLSILVNNASVFEADTVQSGPWDVWDRHFALHVEAPAMLTRNFAAALGDGDEGLVVNVIDQRVWNLTPDYFSYTLSKSALWTATRTMAQALAPRVRVNAIGPGPTLANSRQSPSDFAAQAASVLLGRGPDLAEFGATVRYLWATRSITGQMVALDGGQHLAWQADDVAGIAE